MLEVVKSEKALELILGNIKPLELAETVPLDQALYHVAAEDVISPEDLPAFARSTMDGYAVHASDTFGCSESIPAMLEYDGEIKMGETWEKPLPKGHCLKIPTGGNMPEGADAVSMIEYTDDIGDEFRYVYKPVASLENVNNKGDDTKSGSIILKKGTRITSRNIAILAALGISSVKALKPLSVGIISTGDELIDYTEKPFGAQIRNINSVMLKAEVSELGAKAIVYPIVKDDEAALEAAVKKALAENDTVLISGGSSVGEKDNTFKVLKKLGTIEFHGISIKPGKPTIFATVNGKPAFGLPGHPQAAFFIFKLFAAPALTKMMGEEKKESFTELTLSHNIPSNHGREEIVPVKITGNMAEPIHSKSGVVSVLSAADGYIRVDRNAEGIKQGSSVIVFIL